MSLINVQESILFLCCYSLVGRTWVCKGWVLLINKNLTPEIPELPILTILLWVTSPYCYYYYYYYYKYLNLIEEMIRNYRCVKFVNLSMSSLGNFSPMNTPQCYSHDEWDWHWQKATTLCNQENDKYSH